jgi:hypothetical protein
MRVGFALAAAFGCALLSACGGGGGGGDGGGPPAPVNSISLDKSRLDLFYEQPFGNGNTQEVTVTYRGAGVAVGTLPGQSLPSWIFVSTPTVVNATTVTVRFTFNPTAFEPQRWSTTLRIATADANGDNVAYRDLVVTGTIDHQLSRTDVYPVHTRESTTSPSVSVALQTLNATWDTTTDVSWLQVTPASGTGAASLNVTAAADALAEGNYLGSVTVRDTVTNRTRVLRVHLGVDPRRLETSHRAFAFSQTMAGSVLTHTSRITDTAGRSGRWIATSNAPWLQVSPSTGTGTATLMLTADPTGISDGQYLAEVTISPDNEPGLGNSETIRAGLYVDRVTPVAAETDIGLLNGGPKFASPILPFLYRIETGFPDSTLEVWNLYTATRIGAPLPLPGLTSFRACQSPDGSRIIVVVDGQNPRLQLLQIDGATVTVGPAWTAMRAAPMMKECAITRVSGRNVVFWGNAQVLSFDDGTVLSDFLGSSSNMSHALTLDTGVGASPDGKLGFLTARTLGNHSLYRVQLGNRAGVVTATLTDEVSQPDGGVGAFFSPLSDFAYMATTQGSFIRRFPVAALAPDRTVSLPSYFGSNLLVMPNGHLYAPTDDLWTHYDGDLNVLGTRVISTDGASGVISADGKRMFEVRSGGAVAWGVFSNVDF